MLAGLDKELNGLKVTTQIDSLFSQDSDNNQKISKKELEDYVDNLSLNNQQVPEFLQQLQEKFTDLDKDKDGELSKTEASALQNNRGHWFVGDITISDSASNGYATTQSSANNSHRKENALSELLKDGFEQAAKYAFEKMKDKISVQDIISKVF